MNGLARRGALPAALALAPTALLAILAGRTLAGQIDADGMVLLLAAGLAAGVAVIAWWTDPAWTLSLSLVLAVFSGNWQALGLPGNVTPDRFLLAIALAAVLLRAPGARDRPRLRSRPVHWLLAATAAYALVSAVAAGTLLNGVGGFRLLDRLGLLPFALFFAAPLVFVTERHRRVLALTLTALGGYLGLVTLVQMAGLESLVWPRYILDPQVGTHVGRGRGPFAQAAVNGMAMFACGLAAVHVGAAARSVTARAACGGVVVVCAVGIVLTLQRSVWLGAIAALAITVVATPRLRRYFIPLALVGTVLAVGTLVAVPGLADKAQARGASSETVRDRKNSDHAALNMVLERPLLGFGWDTFTSIGREHYSLSPEYALKVSKYLPVHNVFLGNAAELGLVGTVLWVLALALGVGGALVTRGPPELEPWRTSLLALAVLWLVVANASPLTSLFPNALLWLWAGVVLGPALRQPGPAVSRLWPRRRPAGSIPSR